MGTVPTVAPLTPPPSLCETAAATAHAAAALTAAGATIKAPFMPPQLL